jgi:excisionase family DNA binding protein
MRENENTSGIKTGSQLVDIEEAARVLDVPRSWLYDRTRRNAVPCVWFGKYVRFDLEQLLEWAKTGCHAQ